MSVSQHAQFSRYVVFPTACNLVSRALVTLVQRNGKSTPILVSRASVVGVTEGYSSTTGLNNVCACARFYGSRWRERPGHHTKPRKNGGVFKKFRMAPGLW